VKAYEIDGQMDGRNCDSICALSIYAVVRKKCTPCVQLILRKISKIGATRCEILRLKCAKFDFCWGCATDPAGGAYSAVPDPLVVFKGPTSKGREGKMGRGRKGKGRLGEGAGKEGRRRRERRAVEGNGGRRRDGSMHPFRFSKVGAYATLSHKTLTL